MYRDRTPQLPKSVSSRNLSGIPGGWLWRSYPSSEEGTELQTLRNEPEPEGLSLWDSFFGRGSLFDPFLFGRSMDNSLDAFPLWGYTPNSLFSKDAQAVANTHVYWWESSDAHIIEADLPGATKDDVEITVENGWVSQISGRNLMTYTSRRTVASGIVEEATTAF